MLALIEPVFVLIGVWGLFAAIAPKLRTEIWWMRVWIYGRLQTCLILLAALLLYLALPARSQTRTAPRQAGHAGHAALGAVDQCAAGE